MSKKQKGIRGRSGDNFIIYRRELCKDLLITLSPTSKKDFILTYERALKEKGLTNIPTRQTLSKDIKALGYNFKKGNCFYSTSDIPSDFQIMASTINSYIKQIRISLYNIEKKLFDVNNLPNSYNTNNFLSYVKKYQDSLQEITQHSEFPIEEALTHIYIILDTYGIESYIAENIRKIFAIDTNYLFISTHINCVEIVFEYKDLDSIIKIISYIIESMDFIDTPE